MALRALQGPAGGTAPVGTLGGTTNTIPRWTGPTTLGDSVITQDGTSIGVRQATPSAYLFNSVVVGDPALGNAGITVASGIANDGTLAFADGTVGNNAYRGYVQYSHTTDTLRFGVAGATQITVLNTGNVGIGTASPLSYANYVALTIGDNNAAKTGLLKFRSTYNGGNGSELYQATDGRVILNADGSGSSSVILDPTNKLFNVAPASGWGLKLPATPGNADTQTLDAYQEGTVTATITTTTGTVTLVASQNTLRYTRIGRMVHVQGYLEVQSVTGPPTGDFVINGLPATIGTQSQSSATGAVWTNNMAAGYTGTAVAITLVGTTTLSIRRITTAGANATDFGAYTQAGTSISISIWYSV